MIRQQQLNIEQEMGWWNLHIKLYTMEGPFEYLYIIQNSLSMENELGTITTLLQYNFFT